LVNMHHGLSGQYTRPGRSKFYAKYFLELPGACHGVWYATRRSSSVSPPIGRMRYDAERQEGDDRARVLWVRLAMILLRGLAVFPVSLVDGRRPPWRIMHSIHPAR
jgi:hypothetical protein